MALRDTVPPGLDDGDGIARGHRIASKGLVEPIDTLNRAVQSLTPTAFTDQAIHTTWRLGTGDEQYRWVNRAVFVGEGRLLPGGGGRLGMQHNVYRLA
jgi:Protein of unknown function (DUF3237)